MHAWMYVCVRESLPGVWFQLVKATLSVFAWFCGDCLHLGMCLQVCLCVLGKWDISVCSNQPAPKYSTFQSHVMLLQLNPANAAPYHQIPSIGKPHRHRNTTTLTVRRFQYFRPSYSKIRHRFPPETGVGICTCPRFFKRMKHVHLHAYSSRVSCLHFEIVDVRSMEKLRCKNLGFRQTRLEPNRGTKGCRKHMRSWNKNLCLMLQLHVHHMYLCKYLHVCTPMPLKRHAHISYKSLTVHNAFCQWVYEQF